MEFGAIGIWASLAIFLTSPASSEIDVQKDIFAFFDEYGLKTGLLYKGGSILFFCESDNVKTADCLPPNYFQILGPDGKEAAKYDCKNTTRGGFIPMNITKDTTFGEYKCGYAGIDTSEPFSIDFRLCSDDEPACQEDCADDTKFCIVTGKGESKACTSWTANMCDIFKETSQNRPCPPHKNNGSTCVAIADSYSNVRYDKLGNECPPETNGPKLSFGSGQPRTRYHETFRLNKADAIAKVEYTKEPLLKDYRLSCAVISKTSSFQKTHTFPEKVQQGEIDLNEIFDRGSDVYRFHCIYHSQATFKRLTELISLVYHLFVIEGTVTIAVSDADKGKKLECKIDPPPAGLFHLSYTWTAHTVDASQFTSSEITVTQSDKYTCHVTLTYKTCRPHTTFTDTLNSEEVAVSASAMKVFLYHILPIALCAIARASVADVNT